jgi:hypothetical protein
MSKRIDVATAQAIAEAGQYNFCILVGVADLNSEHPIDVATFGREPSDKTIAVAWRDRMLKSIGIDPDGPGEVREDFRSPIEAARGKRALDLLWDLLLADKIPAADRPTIVRFFKAECGRSLPTGGL